MQIKINRQKVSRYFKSLAFCPKTVKIFETLEGGGGVRLPPPRPPGQYACVTLLSWVQVCCLEKKIQHLCFVLHFFILLMLIWVWINSWKTIAPTVSQMALRQNKS